MLNSNQQGAVSVILGSINSLQAVDWFSGARYMKVELLAFYANQSGATAGSVTGYSAEGDTLYFSGGGYLIVPGISAANPQGN